VEECRNHCQEITRLRAAIVQNKSQLEKKKIQLQKLVHELENSDGVYICIYIRLLGL